MVPNSRKAPQSSAEQPASQHKCAGVGDSDAVAHICYDCAVCLCVGDKLIKMPRFALANCMWLGRMHTLLQNASLGLRLLLGLGRPCFRKLVLGAGRSEDKQFGTTGNHVLVTQGSPCIHELLPPTSRQLSDSFVAVFGQHKEDLSKCQLLTVSKNAYKTLAEERVCVNSVFARTVIDQQAVEALPENGVPQQLIDCAIHMPEVDKYAAARCGPGTIRCPLDTVQEDDDVSNESSDASSNESLTEHAAGESTSSVGQPAQKTSDPQLNQFETPLGLDPTSTPDFVQHVAAFKAQLDLVQDAVKQMRRTEHLTNASTAQLEVGSAAIPVVSSAATAQGAAEEECFRAVLDLRKNCAEAGQAQIPREN